MQTDEETLDSSRYTPEEIRLFEEEVRQGIKEELWNERTRAMQSFPIFPKKIHSVSEKLRAFLLSLERTLFYDSIAKQFSFSQEQRQKIGTVVWNCVLQETWDSLASELEKQLHLPNNISQSVAETLSADFSSFAKKIPSSQSAPQANTETTTKKNILSLSLKKALERYPRIINERVTDADIVFRGSDGPSVPSIKNWITAYHQEMGSGTHEPFERSQFLFHNENTVKLTARERNVLSEILRSLDEESELPINADTQSIDLLTLEAKFPEKEERRTSPAETTTPKTAPSQNSQTLPQRPSFSQVAPTSARPLSQNIPPAQRSEAALYAREFVDDRKDAWHEQPAENKKQEASSVPLRQTAFQPTPVQPLQKNIPSSGNDSFKAPLSPSPTTLPGYNPRPFSAVATPSASPSAPRPLRIQPKINPQKVTPSQQAPLISLFPEQKESTPKEISQHMQTPLSAPTRSQPKEPEKSSKKEDYTDYYPIAPKTVAAPVATNISFSSSHTFPTERKEEEILMPQSQKTPPINTPQKKTLPSQTASQTTPQNTVQTQQPPKKRMIIG